MYWLRGYGHWRGGHPPTNPTTKVATHGEPPKLSTAAARAVTRFRTESPGCWSTSTAAMRGRPTDPDGARPRRPQDEVPAETRQQASPRKRKGPSNSWSPLEDSRPIISGTDQRRSAPRTTTHD